jgi:2-haloacid dehalogenase
MITPEQIDQVEVLTFDCYGTLIDWEAGILGVWKPMLAARGIEVSDEEILGQYVEHEAAVERGPYKPYRHVLTEITDYMARQFYFIPTPEEMGRLADSVGTWKPFPDTVESLQTLASRFKLAVISNVDSDMFAATERALGSPFQWKILADQVGSYKPAPANFLTASKTIGRSSSRILHAAQSLYHDIAPAMALGVATVRVNRASRRPNVGLAPSVDVIPDSEVPDLKTLAETLCG